MRYRRLLLPFLAFCIALSALFWHNYSFHDKYIDIMAKTSMKDDTDTLSIEDRITIRDAMNKFFQDANLRISFHITRDKGMPEIVGENTLAISINPDTKSIEYTMPDKLKYTLNYDAAMVESQAVKHFQICNSNSSSTISDCLTQNLAYLHSELYLKRGIVLPRR